MTVLAVQVAWIRMDSGTILSMDETLITRNQRYRVERGEGGRDWTLSIKYYNYYGKTAVVETSCPDSLLFSSPVMERDQGRYMCQINSDPMRSTTGYLEIKGEQKRGDSYLLCRFGSFALCTHTSPVPPKFVPSGMSDDVTVREGRPASLRCQARGNPEPSVKWMREDGRGIAPATTQEVIDADREDGDRE